MTSKPEILTEQDVDLAQGGLSFTKYVDTATTNLKAEHTAYHSTVGNFLTTFDDGEDSL